MLRSIIFIDDRISGGEFGKGGPGVEKPVVISPKSLKQLTIAVQGPGALYVAKRVTYNYYQTAKLAKDPRLDFFRRTTMYVGGYTDSPNYPIARTFAKFYNDMDYNVLLLDTNKFTTYDYPAAARYIRQAAFHAAEILVNLTQSGLDLSKLELLGLSLGAHTAGYIAKNIYAMTGQKIARITALDPAGPCFRYLPPSQRLDSSDAEFVDVVYTNIDGWGMAFPVGHVNIYVNGGEFQPGDFVFIPCNILCSHIRVITLYTAALVHQTEFIAMKCDSVQQARNHECYDRVPFETNLLGPQVNQSNPGIYYLATDNNYPYYLGEKGLKRNYEFWDSHLKNFNKDDVVVL